MPNGNKCGKESCSPSGKSYAYTGLSVERAAVFFGKFSATTLEILIGHNSLNGPIGF